MSGFWSEALLSVQAKLDAKTESAKERLSSLKETVAATVESAQERIAADIESLKEEHARFIAEQDGDGGSGDEASGGAYTGQNDALPWDVPAKGSDIKALVLGLSRDEATFTRPTASRRAAEEGARRRLTGGACDDATAPAHRCKGAGIVP